MLHCSIHRHTYRQLRDRTDRILFICRQASHICRRPSYLWWPPRKMTHRLKPLSHLFSILVLPCTVTIVIPFLLVTYAGSNIPSWWWFSFLVGWITLIIGLIFVVFTVISFAQIGKWTLAPRDPPTTFVATWLYRYCRNPMIIGVICILLGESIIFWSPPLFIRAGLFTLLNMLYIPLSEEKRLDYRFGQSYRKYCTHVPRWIPRRTPRKCTTDTEQTDAPQNL